MSRLRVLLTVAIVGMVGMWVYVLYLAFGPGRQPPADRLDDPAFAEAAQARCADAAAAVEDLPLASQAGSAAQRADVLDQANGIFADMLVDLDGLTDLAPAGDQRDRSSKWLADWKVMLADREAFADALRDDPEARLLISEKPGTGRHITGWIDEFALANKMDDCVTPSDA